MTKHFVLYDNGTKKEFNSLSEMIDFAEEASTVTSKRGNQIVPFVMVSDYYDNSVQGK